MDATADYRDTRALLLIELIDEVAPATVLVSGSPPGAGGDLDLLLRPEDRETVADGLDQAGFLSRDRMWARFHDQDVDAVELFTTHDFRLPPEESERLFSSARPVRAGGRVSLPAPAETLLLLATRYGEQPGDLAPRHRERIDGVLAEEHDAWAQAESRAEAWHVAAALRALRSSYAYGVAPVDTPSSPRRLRPGSLAGRGSLVALGGLDGSGKSTQARLLRDNLNRLGYDAIVVWSRLEWDTLVEGRALAAIAWPLKAIVGLALRARGRRGPQPAPDCIGAPQAAGVVTPYRKGVDPVSAIRRGSPTLTGAWVTTVALVHALSTRRKLRPHLRGGGVVVCDRYVLDTVVFLRFIYGETRQFRLARRVLAAVSPTPVVTWFLDVAPTVAIERKQDEFDVSELGRLRTLYRESATDLHAIRVDGSRTPGDQAALIGLHTWLALG